MKITLTDKNGNQVLAVESGSPDKSKEDFPIARTVDFDAYKFLLTIAQACSELQKRKPIKFEKENLQITGISCLAEDTVKSMKNDILADPVSFLREEVITFKLSYIDKNKSVPNNNACIKILNATIVNSIKQLLLKNGLHVNLVFDNGDYPIDLKSDYRGDSAYLFVELKNNSVDIQKYEKEFNTFCEKAFKPLIGKKLGQKSTIVKIEPYDNYSDGMHVICDNLDDVDNDYDLMYELENKFNKAIANCPLAKIYDIKFVEDGYYEDLCFYCSVKPKGK